MNFSRTTEYALQIMSFMSAETKQLLTTNDIHKGVHIPFRYLRKIMTALTKKGLLTSVQGKNGGYQISKKLEEISLLDIITATGDQIISDECFFGFENCAMVEKCAMHDKWSAIRQSMIDVLSSTTLSDFKRTGSPVHNTDNNFLNTSKDD